MTFIVWVQYYSFKGIQGCIAGLYDSRVYILNYFIILSFCKGTSRYSYITLSQMLHTFYTFDHQEVSRILKMFLNRNLKVCSLISNLLGISHLKVSFSPWLSMFVKTNHFDEMLERDTTLNIYLYIYICIYKYKIHSCRQWWVTFLRVYLLFCTCSQRINYRHGILWYVYIRLVWYVYIRLFQRYSVTMKNDL